MSNPLNKGHIYRLAWLRDVASIIVCPQVTTYTWKEPNKGPFLARLSDSSTVSSNYSAQYTWKEPMLFCYETLPCH